MRRISIAFTGVVPPPHCRHMHAVGQAWTTYFCHFKGTHTTRTTEWIQIRSPRSMRMRLGGNSKIGLPSDTCFCLLERRNITWSNSVPSRRRESSLFILHGIYIVRNHIGYLLSLSSLQIKMLCFCTWIRLSQNPSSESCIRWWTRAWFGFDEGAYKFHCVVEMSRNNTSVWLKLFMTHAPIDRKAEPAERPGVKIHPRTKQGFSHN